MRITRVTSSIAVSVLAVAGLAAGMGMFGTGNQPHVDPQSLSTAALVQQQPFGPYRFDFSTERQRQPYINAKAVLLVDFESGEVLYAKRADQARPIASITKLVSAMVVLDAGIDLTRTETITRQDAYRSSKSRLRVGTKMTLADLLNIGLSISDNRAFRALARATAGSQEEFVRRMNQKATELGLSKTVFFEPTGLDERNVSTPHEVARLLNHAYDYEVIARLTGQRRSEVTFLNRKRNRVLQLGNSNRMVHSPYRVLAGKTGFIFESDHCLATILQNRDGKRLSLVVLGVPGDRTRFREARKLVDWGFRNA